LQQKNAESEEGFGLGNGLVGVRVRESPTQENDKAFHHSSRASVEIQHIPLLAT
jgi:hypothetical protein